MASSSQTNNQVFETLISQRILRKATINVCLVYKNIRKCFRSKKELKKGDIINSRYIFLKYLGRGSFGKVIKAKKIKSEEVVAIKIIENINNFKKHALQEIQTLTEIENYDPNNEFIVKMLEYFD